MWSKTFVLLALVGSVAPYRLLIVYPTPLHSHQSLPRAVTRGLLEAGHEVVYLTPTPFPLRHPNLTTVDVSISQEADTLQDSAVRDLTIFELFYIWLDNTVQQVDHLMAHEEVQRILREETFDAVLCEHLFTTPLYAFAEHFKVPLITMVSMESYPVNYRMLGNPTHPVFYAGHLFPLPLQPTFLERLRVFYDFCRIEWIIYNGYFGTYDAKMKTWWPHLDANSEQLMRLPTLHIEGTSPIWNTRPLLPNVVQIGFLHLEPPKPLPHDLQEFLDGASEGAIYVSFGGTIKGNTVGSSIIQDLRDVLGSLPYRVVWKLEEDIAVPPNIKLLKWAPQADLLAHPNLRLFITQGGLQSLEEGLARGVPFLVVPFYADQEYNAMKVREFGWGQFLHKADFSAQKLRAAISEVLLNEEYRETVQQASKSALDTPMNPVTAAVWWLEYAVRHHGAPYLKYREADMPWVQYLLLDILIFHLAVLGGVLLVIRLLVAGAMSPKVKRE